LSKVATTSAGVFFQAFTSAGLYLSSVALPR
jgi:hypothetical protein